MPGIEDGAMTATLPPASQSSEERFLFEAADWDFYESVLEKLADRHVFATFDGRSLELMSPSWEHERYSELAGVLIRILSSELGMPYRGGGSTRFKRKDLDAGLEPDRCFYIRNARVVRGKREIDLSVDPPPDLVIEIEISHRLLDRVRIYEMLGVPELWRYNGKSLRVFVADGKGKYRQVDRSPTFPSLPLKQVDEFLKMTWDVPDDLAWETAVRTWVRQNLKKA
jgi:Uma2 family endonuclease